jgi:ferrous iron transport protein B
MASYGPGKNSITQKLYSFQKRKMQIPQEELDNKVAAYKLENSYIGIMGKSIEPAISPLGYDWKLESQSLALLLREKSS